VIIWHNQTCGNATALAALGTANEWNIIREITSQPDSTGLLIMNIAQVMIIMNSLFIDPIPSLQPDKKRKIQNQPIFG